MASGENRVSRSFRCIEASAAPLLALLFLCGPERDRMAAQIERERHFWVNVIHIAFRAHCDGI
jgi:hypothetical protein